MITKQIARGLQIAQLISLLLFLNVVMPPSLQTFLASLFNINPGYLIFGLDKSGAHSERLNALNFDNDSPNHLFLKNYSVLFLIHFVAILAMILGTILARKSEWMPGKFRNLVTKYAQMFGVEQLAFLFMVFDTPGILFAWYNLLMTRQLHGALTFSLNVFAAISYIAMYFLMILFVFYTTSFKKDNNAEDEATQLKLPDATLLYSTFKKPFRISRFDLLQSAESASR